MATLPVGPFKTRLARDEVILGVTVPRRPDPAAMRFAELLDRHSAGKAVVSVAVRPAGDAIDFAIAGLLDRPVTATAPVASLDRSLSEIERSHRPLEDPFHSYRYRREMALVLLHRALAASIEGR
jgi:carbon-monoxide dehydrogenase medium subunit